MADRTETRCFLKILRVEIDDLLLDIDQMVQRFEERYRRREVTENVCLENVGILKNEARSVRGFLQILEDVGPETDMALDVLKDDLLERAGERIRRHGMFPCATILLERKMDKVANYVAASQ